MSNLSIIYFSKFQLAQFELVRILNHLAKKNDTYIYMLFIQSSIRLF